MIPQFVVGVWMLTWPARAVCFGFFLSVVSAGRVWGCPGRVAGGDCAAAAATYRCWRLVMVRASQFAQLRQTHTRVARSRPLVWPRDGGLTFVH